MVRLNFIVPEMKGIQMRVEKVMKEMKEGTGDELWVMHGGVELLYCTPKTHITLWLTNWNLNKNIKKKN